jgi:outer membrane protein TolC
MNSKSYMKTHKHLLHLVKHLMIKMKTAYVGLVVGLFLVLPGLNKASAQTASPRALSFEDAMQLTMKNNEGLFQYKNALLQKQQEQKAAFGLFLPRINIMSTYMLMKEDIHLDLTQVRDAIAPLYNTLGNYGNFSGVGSYPDAVSTQIVRSQLLNGYQNVMNGDWDQTIQKKQFGFIAAGLTQPIFTGGKIILANKAARVNTSEAEIQQKEKYDETYCELVERYYGMVLNNHVIDVRKQVLSTMNEHLSDAEKMEKEGVIANAEFLGAKVYYAEADRELKKSVHQSTIINQGLINTLALGDSGSMINPVSELFYLDSIGSLDSYLGSAKSNSVLLQQVEKKQQLADLNYKAQWSETMPQIAAMGSYNLADKDLSAYVPDYYLGVGLTWNIFEGTSQYHKIKAAKYQQEQADNFYDKASSDIETAINKYYNELSMYLEQIEALNTTLQFAEEYYRVRQKAFAEGMATTTEVSDAELQIAKAKIDQYNAVYNFDLSLSKLLYYAGLMDKFDEFRQSPSAKYLVF